MNVSSVILLVPDACENDGDTHTKLRRNSVMSAVARCHLGAYRNRFG